MESLSPAEMAVAYATRYADEAAVLSWATRYAEAHSEIGSGSALYELLWYKPQRKDQSTPFEHLLDKFIAESSPGFDPKSVTSEAIAKALFEARLQEYLAGTSEPWGVCRMVSPIEQLYDFPQWLGSMYDSCDWIEPDTSRVECAHLADGIRRHLNGG
jgi:hypothetical protein